MTANASFLTPEIIKNITVTQWFNSDFCNFKSRPVKKSTTHSLRCWFNCHIEPFIGHNRICEITEKECNNILYHLIEEGYSHGMLKGVYSALTKIFRSALALNVITQEEYPCAGLAGILKSVTSGDDPVNPANIDSTVTNASTDQTDSQVNSTDETDYTLTLPNNDVQKGYSVYHFSSLKNRSLAGDTIRYLKFCHKNHRTIGYINTLASAARMLDEFLSGNGITDYQHYENYHGDYLLYLRSLINPANGRPYRKAVVRQRYYYPIMLGNYLKKKADNRSEAGGAA